MGEWYCYDPNVPPLGSGAMGTVYLGYRCKDGMKMAIKRVKDSFANNPMIRERAKQEASLAFRHHNLVEMIGYCEYSPEEGPIFLISKFVSGQDIDKYVKENITGPDRVEKICSAMYQVLDALEYVHSRGVIHRDIKPSNIMVEQDSNIRLMDLGIARMNGGNKFSAYGFIGTPQYAAPEQILRDRTGAVQINAATDIYALGITFYELLTGTNPYDCDTEVDTLTKQMRETLPMSEYVPRRLMSVLLKATEKEQSKRYQSAADFKVAIKEAMLPPTSFWETVKGWFS
jgi:serine/threonine-protein kinase